MYKNVNTTIYFLNEEYFYKKKMEIVWNVQQ